MTTENEATIEALNRVAEAIEGFNVILATVATADVVEASARKTRRRVVFAGVIIACGVGLLLWISFGNRQIADGNRQLFLQNKETLDLITEQIRFTRNVEAVVCTEEPSLCTGGHIDPPETTTTLPPP